MTRPGLPAEFEGISAALMPVGRNNIDTTNAYLLADGERLTLVDCGIWRPDDADGGLGALERALNAAGYALRDVSRIVVTHAHVDHYGLTGRIMELTGAQLWMHAMTDLDCEKYRHPETARARQLDTFADHGVTGERLADVSDNVTGWLPYLHSVVEASTRLRGGERIPIGARAWEVIHTPGHSLGHVCLWSATDRLLLSGDHLLPVVVPPVLFERGFDQDPLRSYLQSLYLVAQQDPAWVLPGHGKPFTGGRRRAEAIARSKKRRVDSIYARIRQHPATVTEIADDQVAKAILAYQRTWALTETLANLAYLRSAGLIERRTRADGVYEWYPLDPTQPPA